jgi:hypothetical protein
MNSILNNLIKHNDVLNIKHFSPEDNKDKKNMYEHITHCSITNCMLSDLFMNENEVDYATYEPHTNTEFGYVVTEKKNNLLHSLRKSTYINILIHTNIFSHVFALLKTNGCVYLLDSFLNKYKLRYSKYDDINIIINLINDIINGNNLCYKNMFNCAKYDSNLICIDFELYYDQLNEEDINERLMKLLNQ